MSSTTIARSPRQVAVEGAPHLTGEIYAHSFRLLLKIDGQEIFSATHNISRHSEATLAVDGRNVELYVRGMRQLSRPF